MKLRWLIKYRDKKKIRKLQYQKRNDWFDIPSSSEIGMSSDIPCYWDTWGETKTLTINLKPSPLTVSTYILSKNGFWNGYVEEEAYLAWFKDLKGKLCLKYRDKDGEWNLVREVYGGKLATKEEFLDMLSKLPGERLASALFIEIIRGNEK